MGRLGEGRQEGPPGAAGLLLEWRQGPLGGQAPQVPMGGLSMESSNHCRGAIPESNKAECPGEAARGWYGGGGIQNGPPSVRYGGGPVAAVYHSTRMALTDDMHEPEMSRLMRSQSGARYMSVARPLRRRKGRWRTLGGRGGGRGKLPQGAGHV